MIMRLTAAQRDAIVAADVHVLVTAGAGSGKTSTVVARVLYLLGLQVIGPDGLPLTPFAAPIPLDRIAAITFTNAAAADLKRKLRDALRAAGRRDLAWTVDTARIGTIHSFCGDLLREFALRGGRDTTMEVLDEGRGSALAAEVARDSLLTAAIAGDIEGLDALLARHGVTKVQEWVATLIGDADRLRRIDSRARVHFDPFESTLVDLALRGSERLKTRLDEERATSFDRIITDTRDLLRDQADVRTALRRRLHTLIVDEFQDVDPAQRELAYLIGDPEGGRSETPRLMLVGDPKQSIYRFRRADVTVWEAVRRDFADKSLGRIVELTDNFRSTPEVLAAVDSGIGPLLDAPVDAEAGRQPFEVPHLSLAAGRTLSGDGAPRVTPGVEFLAYVPPSGGKVDADERRDAEAETIADRIVELRAQTPDLGFRDIAVLATATGSFDRIEMALRSRGIPTWQQRSDGFFDRREVQDLILALEVIRDPRDDRALLGWLRSPFVGLRDDTLLFMSRGMRRPLWDALVEGVEVDGEEGKLLSRALGHLRWAVARRDRIPLEQLLEGLLVRTGWLAHHAVQGEGHDQPIANTRKFLRLLRLRSELTVGGLLRLIRDEIAAEVRVGDEWLHGGKDNVVTISTVHASKGLEWPLVFWCDLERGPKNPTEQVVIGRDDLVLKDPERESDDQAPRWKALLEREGQESKAEAKRLWYVAATRARDRLIVSGLVPKSGTGTAAGAVAGVLRLDAAKATVVTLTHQGAATFQAPVRQVIVRAVEGTAVAPEPLNSQRAILVAPSSSAEMGRPRHSATSFLAFGRCERRHRFKYRLGIKEPPIGQVGRGGLVDPITRGSIVHDVLEQYAEEAELEGLLEAAIGRWDAGAPAPETPQGDRYRMHLREEVLRIAQHPEYRAIAETKGAVRELSFVQILSDGAFTEGAMDLAAPGPNGLVLLDVKTSQGDRADCETKAKSYAAQRDVYVAAAGALSGAPVERFAFQFSRAAVQVSESVGTGGTAKAQARVVEIARQIAADADGLAKDPRECRYCGFKEAGWCPGAK